MAGAFHGVTEGDAIINVGVSGPGVVKTALESVKEKDFGKVCETTKRQHLRLPVSDSWWLMKLRNV